MSSGGWERAKNGWRRTLKRMENNNVKLRLNVIILKVDKKEKEKWT